MPTFLFSAEDRHGKEFTDRIEAIDLEHARRVLDLEGFSAIKFHYDSAMAKAMSASGVNNYPKIFNPIFQKAQYDSRLSSNWLVLLFQVLVTVSFWIPIFAVELSAMMIVTNAAFTAFMIYLFARVVVTNRLVDAICRCECRRMRFWGHALRLLTIVRLNPMARFAADSSIALADARAGRMDSAIARVRVYQTNALIPKALYDNAIAGIFEFAGDYEREFAFQESRLAVGELDTEQILRLAGRVARKRGNLEQARALMRTAASRELTEVAETLMPLIQGIIETEAGNYRESEFYLIEAEKRLHRFRHHAAFAGGFAFVNSYLAIVLAQFGKSGSARARFAAARRYLEAANERELLERCSRIVLPEKLT